jgi:predicted TIM-barrel fold metal-dependent hydrolase
MQTALDWIFAEHLLRFPELQICLSEGGIGWVLGLRDRLVHAERKLGCAPQAAWAAWDRTPSEVLLHSFRFCFLTDPTSLELRHEIGVDRIMFEVDYPHSDSSWPDSQQHFDEQVEGFPTADVDRLAWRNAAHLFRHAVPAAVQRDPHSF